MRSPLATWPPTTPKLSATTPCAAAKFSNAFRPAGGANRKISQAPPCFCVLRQATMSMAIFWWLTADGWLADQKTSLLQTTTNSEDSDDSASEGVSRSGGDESGCRTRVQTRTRLDQKSDGLQRQAIPRRAPD